MLIAPNKSAPHVIHQAQCHRRTGLAKAAFAVERVFAGPGAKDHFRMVQKVAIDGNIHTVDGQWGIPSPHRVKSLTNIENPLIYRADKMANGGACWRNRPPMALSLSSGGRFAHGMSLRILVRPRLFSCSTSRGFLKIERNRDRPMSDLSTRFFGW